MRTSGREQPLVERENRVFEHQIYCCKRPIARLARSAVSRIAAVHISQERSRRNWKIEKLSPMLFLGELTEVMFAQLFAGVELDDGLS